MANFVDKCASTLNERLELNCGYTDVELEGRFEFSRSCETNVGNWLSDVIHTDFVKNDIVLLNGGTIRSNAVIPIGNLTYKTMANLIPMDDKIVQLEVPGRIVLEALENSVSSYPKMEGKFAQVAGLNFKWDSSKEPFSRVLSVEMWDGSDLDPEEKYTLATKFFIAKGQDGYSCF